MEEYARSAPSIDYKIISIEQPYSFFDFAEKYFTGQLNIHRLFSQIRMLKGKTMVMENISHAKDTFEENEDIQKRKKEDFESSLTRLSFFNKKFSTNRGLKSAKSNQFLGYIIIKKDYFKKTKNTNIRVYESVIQSSSHSNNYIHGSQKWQCKILNNAFIINGWRS